jgi:hypothetical protein
MPKYIYNPASKSINVAEDLEDKEDFLKNRIKNGRSKGMKVLSKAELLELLQLLNVKYDLKLE